MLEKKRGKERIVYLDGRFVPESQARISIFDTAFHNAYMVHEAIRTFNGKLFKLEEHTARLFRSLRCARIDAAMGPSEMKKISLEVLEANQHLLGKMMTTGFTNMFQRELYLSLDTRIGPTRIPRLSYTAGRFLLKPMPDIMKWVPMLLLPGLDGLLLSLLILR